MLFFVFFRGLGVNKIHCKTERLIIFLAIRRWTNRQSILLAPHPPFISCLWGPWGPSGSRCDDGQQAVGQALAVAPPVTIPHPAGTGGAGPQREPAGWAGAEDHSHRDHSDRNGVRGVELALPYLSGPLVLFQLLHFVPQQVHPVSAAGGAQHAG